jgi:hypothetical protein
MQALNLHTADGVIVRVPGVGILDAYGTTVPADGSAGYATGCIFRHTDGTAGTALYCNEGTDTSCNFDAVTVA